MTLPSRKENLTPSELTQNIAEIVLSILGETTQSKFTFIDNGHTWEYEMYDSGAGIRVIERYEQNPELIDFIPQPEGGWECSAPDRWLPQLYERLYKAREIQIADEKPRDPTGDYTHG